MSKIIHPAIGSSPPCLEGEDLAFQLRGASLMHVPGGRLAPDVGPAVVGLKMILLRPDRSRNWLKPRGCLVPDIAAGTLPEAGAWLQGGILEHFHS